MARYEDQIEKGVFGQAELEQKLQADFEQDQWTALAIYTAGVACFVWTGQLEAPSNVAVGDKSDYDHLLELRLFNEQAEFHALRGAMGKPFSWRLIDDAKGDFECIDEKQLLDIDEDRSGKCDPGVYYSIGGGRYSLPVADAKRVLVRNYIDFDDEGMARVVDFRIVEFLKGGEE